MPLPFSMKKKFKLLDHFSIKIGREVVVGPKEVELSEEEAHGNYHKLEPLSAESESKAEAKSAEKAEDAKPSKAKK